MKITALALTAATAGLALAQPHHQHRHFHEQKREVTVTENVPGPTAYAYVLDGQEISVDQVCEGIDSHELKWADGTAPSGICSTTSAAPTSTTTTTSSTTTTTTTPTTTTTTTSTTTTTTTTTPSTTTTTTTAATSSSAPAEFFEVSSSTPSSSSSSEAASSSSVASSKSSSSSFSSGGTGISASFPDGELDCSTFPSDYGAVAVDYLGLGGWSGLQDITVAGGAVTNIVTGVSGDSCKEGMMCSYACPPGYQKSQWPSTQGATGQSVGGISCSGGKLHLTNPSLSTSLCISGVGGVQATNNAGSVVSICRTDYPGTESETIPVELQPGGTEALTVPDASAYYEWEGQSTSAQYYLNPPGYGPSDACQWGSPGKPLGNYAPINFGVGAKGGTTYLSIFQNAPTTNAQYPGTVELTGNLSGSCKYSNGQYCSASGCNSNGCTVSSVRAGIGAGTS